MSINHHEKTPSDASHGDQYFLRYLWRHMPTDITNGERFAKMFRGRLKYAYSQPRYLRGRRRRGGWFIWSESGWTRAPFDEVKRAAKTVAAAVQAEADEYSQLGAADDPETRQLIKEFVRASRRPSLRGMIETAKSEPGMYFDSSAPSDSFD